MPHTVESCWGCHQVVHQPSGKLIATLEVNRNPDGTYRQEPLEQQWAACRSPIRRKGVGIGKTIADHPPTVSQREFRGLCAVVFTDAVNVSWWSKRAAYRLATGHHTSSIRRLATVRHFRRGNHA